MNFLVVNDDGIEAKGISILAKALTKYGNVYVVAPDRSMSAKSMAITLQAPITFNLDNTIDGVTCYRCGGTPTDCVRLALSILDVKFDYIFSGINDGLNVGDDILYSGTIGAASEGILNNIPSVALSTDRNSFDVCINYIDDILEHIFNNNKCSNEYVLNINFPVKKYRKPLGIKEGIMGKKKFLTEFQLTNDGYIGIDKGIVLDDNEKSDVYLSENGYVSLVPISVNRTYIAK